MRDRRRPMAVAGVLLGMGLAGFLDGIVLHQILQWHHMVCRTETCHPASIDDLRRMDTQDGYFHLGMLAVGVAGVFALYSAGADPSADRSGRLLGGSVLGGFGLFNVAEGLVDHHLLRIHHVLPGPTQGAWDLGFLTLSAVVLAAGWAVASRRSGPFPTSEPLPLA